MTPSTSVPTVCLDWLTFTIPIYRGAHVPTLALTALPFALVPDELGPQTTLIKGYNTGVSYRVGAACYHSEHPRMKLCVQLTGDDLSRLAAYSVTALEVVAHAISRIAHFTRIDIAVDLHSPGIHPLDLKQAYEQGTARTSADKGKLIEGFERRDGKIYPAHTVYIGSSASDHQLRVYNKAEQTGTPGDWHRVELVVRHDPASALAPLLLEHGIPDAGIAAILKFFDCDVPWWKAALGVPAVEIPAIPRKVTDREKWLTEDILPILESYVAAATYHDDWTVYDRLEVLVRRYAFRRAAHRARRQSKRGLGSQ